MIAIGNNEKCPWCDTIITEEIDTLEHLMSNHTIEAMRMLFPRGNVQVCTLPESEKEEDENQ